MAVATTGERAGADLRRIIAGVLAVALVVASLGAALVLNAVAGLSPGPNEYNVAAWEVRNVPGKWLFLAGQLIRGEPSDSMAAMR